MNAQPSHVISASDLARTVGMTELDLHRFAYEHRLPFFCGPSGWGISRHDLETWKTAASLAHRARENVA